MERDAISAVAKKKQDKVCMQCGIEIPPQHGQTITQWVLHTILLDLFIKLLLLGRILQIILLSRTSFGTDPDTNHFGIRAIRQGPQTSDRGRCLSSRIAMTRYGWEDGYW